MAHLIMADGSVLDSDDTEAVESYAPADEKLTAEDLLDKSMNPVGQEPKNGEPLCKGCGQLHKGGGDYCEKCAAGQKPTLMKGEHPLGPMARAGVDFPNTAQVTASLDALEDLVKGGGEGTRGGEVIGHTSSGKPIYRSSKSTAHFKEQHQGWSAQDHKEAQDAHADHMDKVQKLARPHRDAIDAAGGDQAKRAEAFKKLYAVKDEHDHSGSEAKYADHGRAVRRLKRAEKKAAKTGPKNMPERFRHAHMEAHQMTPNAITARAKEMEAAGHGHLAQAYHSLRDWQTADKAGSGDKAQAEGHLATARKHFEAHQGVKKSQDGLGELEDLLEKSKTPEGGLTPGGYRVKTVGGKRTYVKEGPSKAENIAGHEKDFDAAEVKAARLAYQGKRKAAAESYARAATAALNLHGLARSKADKVKWKDRYLKASSAATEMARETPAAAPAPKLSEDAQGALEELRRMKDPGILGHDLMSDEAEELEEAGLVEITYHEDLDQNTATLTDKGRGESLTEDVTGEVMGKLEAWSKKTEASKPAKPKSALAGRSDPKHIAEAKQELAEFEQKGPVSPAIKKRYEQQKAEAKRNAGEAQQAARKGEWAIAIEAKNSEIVKWERIRALTDLPSKVRDQAAEKVAAAKSDLEDYRESQHQAARPTTEQKAELILNAKNVKRVAARISKAEAAELRKMSRVGMYYPPETHRKALREYGLAEASPKGGWRLTDLGSAVLKQRDRGQDWRPTVKEDIWGDAGAREEAKKRKAARAEAASKQMALFRSMGFTDLDDFLLKSEMTDEELIKFLGAATAVSQATRSSKPKASSGGYTVGKRGGHIIGKTASGKPIYADKSPGTHAGEYKGWSEDDHRQAADAHRHWAQHRSKTKGEGYDHRHDQHSEAAGHHDRIASYKPAGEGKASDWHAVESKDASHFEEWEHDAAAEKHSERSKAHYSDYSRAQEARAAAGKRAKRGLDHPDYRKWSTATGKAAAHRRHKWAKERGEPFEEATLLGRMKRKFRQELLDRSQTATESSMSSTLEEFLEKAEQGMPSGEPNQDMGKRRTEDGMGLEGAPKPSGTNTSGASPAIGETKPSKDKLSEDDAEDEKQMKEHKKPIEKGGTKVGMGKSLAAPTGYSREHAAQVYAHADAVERSRLMKGAEDVAPQLAQPQPETPQGEPLEKARHFSTFGGMVQVSNQADLEIERLQKSDGFWHGEAPGLTPAQAPIHQLRQCECGALVKSFLTACPECTRGAVESRVLPTEVGGPILEKSQGPVVLRPRRQPPDIYIPDGPDKD